MYLSIRRYELDEDRMDELLERIDTDFVRSLQVRPGFASYEAIDCGGGELLTMSAFTDAEQAEASRALARTWTGAALEDLPLELVEVLHGELLVNRAERGSTRPAHSGDSTEHAELRWYKLERDAREELAHVVAADLAPELAAREGFLAYELTDCGEELFSRCLFAEPETGQAAAGVADAFMASGPGIPIGEVSRASGRVGVGRTRPRMLQPVGG